MMLSSANFVIVPAHRVIRAFFGSYRMLGHLKYLRTNLLTTEFFTRHLKLADFLAILRLTLKF